MWLHGWAGWSESWLAVHKYVIFAEVHTLTGKNQLVYPWITTIWCFMALSKLFQPQPTDARVIMKGSEQWSPVQKFPAGTQCINNVDATLIQRQDVEDVMSWIPPLMGLEPRTLWSEVESTYHSATWSLLFVMDTLCWHTDWPKPYFFLQQALFIWTDWPKPYFFSQPAVFIWTASFVYLDSKVCLIIH